MSAAPRPPARSPLDRPVGRLAIVLAVPVLGLLPYVLMLDDYGTLWGPIDPFGHFALAGDDFPYLAESRTAAALRANLWTPHNAHVVPLFRLGTHLLGRASGSLAALPRTLGLASYTALVATMLLAARFVARETRRPFLGLAAMGGVGLSTVIEPAATWFSAGQTLWAAAVILGVLHAAQGWRDRGGGWRLGLAVALTIAAPGVWSGGYAAGPVAAAYLLADRSKRSRRAAWLPMAASLVVGGLVLVAFGGRLFRSGDASESPGLNSPLRGLAHTAQAIPEVLLVNELGLDATTDARQAIALCLGLGAAWLWSSRGRVRPNPLEAAGGAMVLLGFGLAYSFRAGFPYSSLRGLDWYETIPHVGLVLFAAGWWSARSSGRAVPSPDAPPGATGRPRPVLPALPTGARVADDPWHPSPLRWREVVAILCLAAAVIGLHAPRALRRFLAGAPPMTPYERSERGFPIPSLQRLRAIYFAADHAERQRRALARLDRVGRTAARMGLGRQALRLGLGRVEVPGWPAQVRDLDALDLLDLPATGDDLPPDRVRALFGGLVAPEPAVRPAWLPPDEPWPAAEAP